MRARSRGTAVVVTGFLWAVTATAAAPTSAASATPFSIPTLLTALPAPPVAGAAYGGDGYNVAISGNTAVVVAIHTDQSTGPGSYEIGQGAAFIYVRHGAKWPSTPTTTLHAPSPLGQFGTSLAIDGSTIVVTDPFANGYPNVTNSGEAYVYVNHGGKWPSTPTTTLVDPLGRTDDQFGVSTAISGTSLLVGAPGSGPSQYGIVYEYSEGATSWPTTPTLTLPDPTASATNASNDYFGETLAVSGTTMVISSYGQFGDGIPLVYGFTEGSTGWSSSPNFTINRPETSDFSLIPLGLSGDTLVAAAFTYAHDESSVLYLYSRSRTGWSESPTATIFDPNPSRDDQFAYDSAISGRTLIVGSDASNGHSGLAYVFTKGNTGMWPTIPNATIADPQATRGDVFSSALAISGATAIFGAGGANSTPLGSGAAYLYSLN